MNRYLGILGLLGSSLLVSCTQYGYIPVYQPVQQVSQQPVQYYQVQQQPVQQFDILDVVDKAVYVSGGVTRIASNYNDIRNMNHDDEFRSMWNDRYRLGLDTRPNTQYGVQSYDRGYGYGGGHYGGGHYGGYRSRPGGYGGGPRPRYKPIHY